MNLFPIFRTFLTAASKLGKIPFLKYDYNGNEAPDGAPTLIEADFTRPTTASETGVRKVIDASGNLVDVAEGIPAWTYPIGGKSAGCPYLSFLPSVENLVTYSEEFDNAAWTKQGLTITANSATSPDGTTNADTLDEGTAASASHWLFQGASLSNSTTYTIQIAFKYVDAKYVAINIFDGAASSFAYYDIENFVMANTPANREAGIENIGNGWALCYYTATTAASGTPNFRIGIANSTGTAITYTGTNRTVYAWGAQLKEGSYISPLDYVKTEASAVTRAVDSITNITDLQGDGYLSSTTEGSVIIQFRGYNGSTASLFEFGSNLSARQLAIIETTNLGWRAFDYNESQQIIDYITDNGLQKLVLCWSGNTLNGYLNGFLVYSNTWAGGDYTITRIDDMFTGNGADLKMLNFAPTALTPTEAEKYSAWESWEEMVADLNYEIV